MGLRFFTFESGSSGNSYLLQSDTTSILLDCGTAGKNIIKGLEELSMTLSDIDAILLTHEHIDHVKSINMISKKARNATVYGSHGTIDSVREKIHAETIEFDGEEIDFFVGDIKVEAFPLSHDAVEPTGFSISDPSSDKRITVITDTGKILPEMKGKISESDLLILEANHEYNILMMCDYPFELKKRISGDYGHLSNEAAGECLCEMLRSRKKGSIPIVCLAHLSSNSNSKEQAYATVANILESNGFYIGKNLAMDVMRKGESGFLIEI